EQLLMIAPGQTDPVNAPDPEGTYFYGSPRRAARMALQQLLVGGYIGMVVRIPGEHLTIGREGNDVNFPDDPFISGRHANVTALDSSRAGADAAFELQDLGSKNGTFLRIQDETVLQHGDYVFIGQQLLRVEIS